MAERPFTIEHRGDHIHVELRPYSGPDQEWQQEYWSLLRTACQEHDTCRVLVEGTPPRSERTSMEIVEAGRRTANVPSLWLGYCLEGFERNEQTALYETVASTGGVRVKFFSEHDKALQWLRANSTK